MSEDLKKVTKIRCEEPTDNDMIWGEITSNTIPHLNHLMEYIYAPAIDKLSEPWDENFW
jgi:hypothetical protein